MFHQLAEVLERCIRARQGELELNPAYAWRFKIQAPTWNTVLDPAEMCAKSRSTAAPLE